MSTRLRRDEAFVRVRAGVYADKSAWFRLAPWTRYLARVHAVAAVRPCTTFILESAGVLLGMPTFGEPRLIHVLGEAGSTSRRYGDVVVHTSKDDRALLEVAGFRLTSLVDSTLDLCRMLPPAFAVATADATLRRLERSGDTVDLRQHAGLLAGRRGALQLNWALDRATPAAESVGESVSRVAVEWLGFEQPELQVWFRYEGHDDRCDFFWRRQRIIGESDGYGKYDSGDVEQVKARLIDEKTREDRLRRYESAFARWDWSDTIRATPLDSKLQRAGLRPTQPRRQAMLMTLRSNPRSFPS